ncbi:50S ribosome-binding protein YggL [Ferrimonas futtsuensis]|uniref:50S ribosome-binding protein YggL n=1 Tax=Ferrimonas futtsuensis TaxID=364764 RepID=UPI000413DB73|nr:50S ribosome-binding protein YggL [Ferrimonas futtsuensis]
MTTIPTAKNRSRRLRKKLRVDEFQELGFDLSWRFNDDVTEEQIDALVDQLIEEVIEPLKLGYSGGGHKAWDGIVCTQKLGKCTEEHRQAVEKFFADKPVTEVNASELYDIWWG